MTIMTVAEYQAMAADSTTATGTISSALNRYTAIIERYCNRTWGRTCYTETFYDVQVDPIVLDHSDVQQITLITAGTVEYDPEDLNIKYAQGFIWHGGLWFDADVSIQYTAGSDAPADVQHVLATLVQGFLAGTSGGVNAVYPVAQETVYGVASTKYSTAGYLPESGGHAELGPMTTLLDYYVEPVLA